MHFEQLYHVKNNQRNLLGGQAVGFPPPCSPHAVLRMSNILKTLTPFSTYFGHFELSRHCPPHKTFCNVNYNQSKLQSHIKNKKLRYFQYPGPFIFPINTSSLKCNIHSSPQSLDTMAIIQRTATKGLRWRGGQILTLILTECDTDPSFSQIFR